MRLASCIAALACASSAVGRSSTGSRLLVVVDDDAEKAKYATFWDDLHDRGFETTFEPAKNPKLSLFQHGEKLFDHLILLPSQSKGLGPALAPKLLLQFLHSKGNILLGLGGSTTIPAAIGSLLLEFDIQTPPDRQSIVVDHFNHDKTTATDRHDVIVVPRSQRNGLYPSSWSSLFGGSGSLIFPRAVPQELAPGRPMLAPLLKAGKTAYSYNAKNQDDVDDEPWGVGEQMNLVSAMQARNSARLTVFGSVEALQDEWFKAEVEGLNANREFAQQVTAWTFQETGVLHVGDIEHHLSKEDPSATPDSPRNPSMYRIKNDVTVNVDVSEYRTDTFVPYVPDQSDPMQIDCTMLSPFQRLDLQSSAQTQNATRLSRTFRLPDQHGIFRFQVSYQRPLLTNVDVRTEVTVRHFAHDEWPRSWQISAGWVWIAGIWTTIAGWLAFVGIWLWSAPIRSTSGTKKVQ